MKKKYALLVALAITILTGCTLDTSPEEVVSIKVCNNEGVCKGLNSENMQGLLATIHKADFKISFFDTNTENEPLYEIYLMGDDGESYFELKKILVFNKEKVTDESGRLYKSSNEELDINFLAELF